MSSDQRRKITTITSSRSSSSYGASNNRSTLGYWIPLAITVTAATVALGAWIWSERGDEEESDTEPGKYYANAGRTDANQSGGLSGAAVAAGAAGLGAAAGYSSMSGGLPPGPGPAGSQPQPPPGAFVSQPPVQGGFQGPPGGSMPRPPDGEASNYFRQDDQSRSISTGVTYAQQEDTGFMARVSNVVGTNLTGDNWATRGLAVAGSMVGGAVNAVRGSADDNSHFSDQEKWSEEADKPERTMSPRKSTGSFGAGDALAAAAGAGAAIGTRSLTRQGTAAEFYAGEVDLPRRTSMPSKRRKTVAVIVSSYEKVDDGLEVDAHLSILAQLPMYLKPDTTRIIVLIYSPEIHTHPLSLISRRASSRQPGQSAAASVRSQSTSSYANINTPGANGTPLQTPGDFPQDSLNEDSDDKGILAHVDPKPLDGSISLSRSISQDPDRRDGDNDLSLSRRENPLDSETNSLFKTLYNQANALVDRDTSILPFNAADGHKHILRSIQPEIVYIQESLCGVDGSLVTELQGWVRQTVVVIGDEGGMGGLVDSDTEEEDAGTGKRVESEGSEKWWRKESVTGLGRGVSVVESLRVGDDWRRRVNEEE